MESAKLNLIKQELDRLDQLINTDISVIRDKIEVASREFLEAQYVVMMIMSGWSPQQAANPLIPTVAMWMQLKSILCHTGLSRHL